VQFPQIVPQCGIRWRAGIKDHLKHRLAAGIIAGDDVDISFRQRGF
jgi:hypothetical protein